MARHNRVVTRRGSDRIMTWIGVNIGATAVAGGSAVLAGTLNAAALALRPFTVIRSRVVCLWTTDQFVASEAPFGAVGSIVVKEDATAAGVASLPAPATEFDANWVFYQSLLADFVFGDATGFVDNSVGTRWEIDSKSMRKVGLDEQHAVVVDNTSGVGAGFTMIGRLLLKLH